MAPYFLSPEGIEKRVNISRTLRHNLYPFERPLIPWTETDRASLLQVARNAQDALTKLIEILEVEESNGNKTE